MVIDIVKRIGVRFCFFRLWNFLDRSYAFFTGFVELNAGFLESEVGFVGAVLSLGVFARPCFDALFGFFGASLVSGGRRWRGDASLLYCAPINILIEIFN